jgi:hypothetical protein
MLMQPRWIHRRAVAPRVTTHGARREGMTARGANFLFVMLDSSPFFHCLDPCSRDGAGGRALG